jgi:hypothetical protein
LSQDGEEWLSAILQRLAFGQHQLQAYTIGPNRGEVQSTTLTRLRALDLRGSRDRMLGPESQASSPNDMSLKGSIQKVLDGERLTPDEEYELYTKAELPHDGAGRPTSESRAR